MVRRQLSDTATRYSYHICMYIYEQQMRVCNSCGRWFRVFDACSKFSHWHFGPISINLHALQFNQSTQRSKFSPNLHASHRFTNCICNLLLFAPPGIACATGNVSCNSHLASRMSQELQINQLGLQLLQLLLGMVAAFKAAVQAALSFRYCQLF